MRTFKSKKKLNKGYYLGIVLFLIVILTIYIINYVGKRVSPKLIEIIKDSINLHNNHLIMDYIDMGDFITDNSLDNIVNFVKNDKNEIIAIDYNMNNSYKLLKEVTRELKSGSDSLKYNSFDNYMKDIESGMILAYPIGLGSDNVFLNNLGYKVPIKVELTNSMITSLKTKVSNYGINNSLVEMYLSVNIKSKIITPFVYDNIDNEYKVLIGAKMIMGSVPSYLNGVVENSSSYME